VKFQLLQRRDIVLEPSVGAFEKQ